MLLYKSTANDSGCDREMSDRGQSTAAADQAARDNRSDQLNPNNPNYQGGTTSYTGTGTRADLNNHGNQLNPNNPEFGGGSARK